MPNRVYQPALQRRAAHWYELALPELAGLEQMVAKRRLLELETAANDGWRVVFRGTEPAHWNTTIDQHDAFAIALDDVADSIKFLRLRQTGSGQFIVVPITKDLLASGGAISPRLMWHVDISRRNKSSFLGIANNAFQVTDGQPYVYSESRNGYAGWGFGGVWKQPQGRAISWAGQVLGDVQIEISVKSDNLSPDEQRALLR